MSLRKILDRLITIFFYLFHTLSIRSSANFDVTNFVRLHIPNLQRFKHKRNSKHLAISSFATEFCKKIKIEPCTQCICFSPQSITKQFIIMFIQHIADFASVFIFQKQIDIINTFIIPVPICLKWIISWTSHTYCHSTDNVGP